MPPESSSPTSSPRTSTPGASPTAASASSTSFSATRRRALSYRQHFARRWATFLHEHFEGPEHVAHVFGVNATTARNWWWEVTGPSGFAVALAFDALPEQAASALRVRP